MTIVCESQNESLQAPSQSSGRACARCGGATIMRQQAINVSVRHRSVVGPGWGRAGNDST